MTTSNQVKQEQQPGARPPKKKKFKWGKFIVVLLVSILIPLMAYGAFYAYKVNQTFDQITAPSGPLKEKELAKNKPLTILLLGKDSRPETSTLNTDVIMCVTMNPDTHKVTVVSLPRDTRLDISDYSEDHKANWFYAAAYNDSRRNYSSEKARKAYINNEVKHVFGETFQVPIDYIVMVDFNTLKDIVDAVGGVKVTVKQAMRYVDPTDGTNIDLKPGTQVLDGKNALDFVRYRKSNRGTAGTDDSDRNKRQQQVIRAILKKVKSPDTLLRGKGILNAVKNNVQTDIPKQQMFSIIKTYIGNTPNKNIEFISLYGVWISPFVEIAQQDFDNARAKLKARLMTTEPSPSPTSTP
jgi:LCP family protein required for cell wall assembly